MREYAERQLKAQKRKANNNMRDQPLSQAKQVRNEKKDAAPAATRKSSRVAQQKVASDPINIATQENEEDFPGIRPYFTPTQWGKLSLMTKKHLQSAADQYYDDTRKGIPTQLPKFMVGQAGNESSTLASCATSTQGMEAAQCDTPDYPSTSRDTFPLSKENERLASLASKPSSSQFPQGGKKQFGLDNTRKKLLARQPLRDINNTIVQSNNTPERYHASFHDDCEDSISTTNESIEQELLLTDTQVVASDKKDMESVIKSLVIGVAPSTSPEILSKLVEKLIDLGVESEDDLPIVKAEWLSELGLKPVQLTKILNAFTKHISSGQGQQISKATKKRRDTELMRQHSEDIFSCVTPISSRPHLAQKQITVNVMGGFVLDFSKFRDSLLKSLEKKQSPTPSDRENMVYVISMDMIQKYEELKRSDPTITQKTPGKTVYREVVTAVFQEFSSCFADTLRGKVVQDGKFSLTDQIETCVENKYRNRKANSERSSRTRGNRAAACILPEKYAPALTRDQKKEGEQIRKTLLAVYRSPKTEWDWEAIKEQMVNYSSLASQRAMITARTGRYMDVLVENWPFLFELNGLLCHLDHITNTQLLSNFEKFIDNDLDDLILYLTIMSPNRLPMIKLNNEVALGSGIHRRLVSAVFMLAMHWSEDPDVLFSCVEASTMPHEVVDILGNKLPETPHIVAVGRTIFAAKEFYIFMENVCICHVHSGLEAVMALCASYFVFGVMYPNKASNTLTYIERIMAKLTDDAGLLKATTPRGFPCNTALGKILSFDEAMGKFAAEYHRE